MRVRGLWDVAALPRADIAKVAEQKGGLCNVSVHVCLTPAK